MEDFLAECAVAVIGHLEHHGHVIGLSAFLKNDEHLFNFMSKVYSTGFVMQKIFCRSERYRIICLRWFERMDIYEKFSGRLTIESMKGYILLRDLDCAFAADHRHCSVALLNSLKKHLTLPKNLTKGDIFQR